MKIFIARMQSNFSEFLQEKARFFLYLSIALGTYPLHGKTVVPGMLAIMPEWEIVQLKDPRGPVEIKRPKNWEYLQGAFGLTHLFVTHPKVKNRTSISLTVTGINNLDFGAVAGERDYPQYKEGRLRWASKMGATISQFEPYSFGKNNYANPIHKGGVAYNLSGKHYQEFSYFIMCSGKKSNLIHLKAVSRDSAEAIRPIMDEMAYNLKCL